MISAQERRWALTFALLLMVVTTIPYWLGYFCEGAAWRFSGFVFGVEDGNSYMAKMLAGANGDFLFRTPYTAFPQSGVVAFLPYLLLGKLSSAPAQHEQLVALFHLFRWLGGFGFVLACYTFIALFIPAVRWRRWGTALASVGGGLGWLAILGLGRLFRSGLPLEFYSPETFGFLSIYGLPHLALGRALLLGGLVCYLKPAGSQATRQAMWGGMLWLLLGFMQPLTVVVAWAVLGTHLAGTALLAKLGRLPVGHEGEVPLAVYWRKAVLMVLLSSPLVLYTVVSFASDPYLKQWAVQNRVLSPSPLDYLLAYGLVLPLAGWGAVKFWKERSWLGYLPVFWALLLPVLVYAPYNLQRRLAEGAWVALIVLALKALQEQKPRWQAYWQGLLASGFLSAVILLAGGVEAVLHPATPQYQPAETVTAFEYLATQAHPGEVVLASYATSNALPAWASLRVVIGHGPESMNLAVLEPRVERFFEVDTPDEERRALLQEFNVRYVFWGSAERALGGWDPQLAGYLHQVYSSGNTRIFAVVGDSLVETTGYRNLFAWNSLGELGR